MVLDSSIKIEGFICARIRAKGPVLYYMSDFESEYDICSIYWKVDFGGKSYLVDTGIKDMDYINGTTRSGNVWERLDGIRRFDHIDYIFPTHLHYDHCSGIYDHDKAKIILAEKTFDNIMDKRFGIIYKEKIFSKEILERVRSREACLTIKEGSEVEDDVVVDWCGGHTPCSQIVIFKTGFHHEGRDYRGILFSGDIMFTYRNIDEKIPGGLIYDMMDFYDFYDKYANKGYMVIPGHDCSALKKIKNSK
jgi:glyoxylase-like metal-dependent hydrolase (beta-lactamase superfamily II)